MKEDVNPADISQEFEGAGSDEELIFRETAGMVDRDQVFKPGWQQSPQAAEADVDDDWSGEQEEGFKGDRNLDEDLVDALERLPYRSDALDPLGPPHEDNYGAWPAEIGDDASPETLDIREKIRQQEEGSDGAVAF